MASANGRFGARRCRMVLSRQCDLVALADDELTNRTDFLPPMSKQACLEESRSLFTGKERPG